MCVAASLLPLWIAGHVPAVDVPQHLFLIDVLRDLEDPASTYRDTYVGRPGLTYLTFYYTVKALSGPLGVELALKVWLTGVLAAIPFSLAVLLRALGRSPWLALLSCPLLYTDNFYWGLVSFQSSLPLTFLTVAFFIRALEDPTGEFRSTIALAVSLVLLQLTHAAGIIYPAIALPLMLAVTPSDWPRRARAILGVTPGVALFLVWLFSGVNRGRQLGAPGEPWKASAPLLDRANFTFAPVTERAGRFVELLSNGFWSYADRWPLYLLAAVGLLGLLLALLRPESARGSFRQRARPALLFGVALTCYLLLPSDIRGYMYYIFPRYAQVAALLALPLLPVPTGLGLTAFGAAASIAALASGINLAVLFRRFDVEAENFERVARDLPQGSRVMSLVFDRGSRHAAHAVYLHYAALGALRCKGIPSFSLATDPSFPVGYADGKQPPAPASEWRPEDFSFATHGDFYDAFLVRGDVPPGALFGEHLSEVTLRSQADRWRLFVRHRR